MADYASNSAKLLEAADSENDLPDNANRLILFGQQWSIHSPDRDSDESRHSVARLFKTILDDQNLRFDRDGRPPTAYTINITHAHFDHFYHLSILLDRFPGARAIATPKTLNAMQMSFTPSVERLARRCFPGQVPTKLVAPEPYEHDTFTLEGHDLRIIEQGHTDSAVRRLYTFHRSA